MKISLTDEGQGIFHQFARAIGATIDGRFIYIPESKGGGYITGFNWGSDLRMIIRYYYLKDDVIIERTNKLAEGQDDIVFRLSGIFPPLIESDGKLTDEQSNVMICRHAVSSIIEMPLDTVFGSVTIAVSRRYLRELFGTLDHPLAISILDAHENFVYETGISPEIIETASYLIKQVVPESLESRYSRLKCEELLCLVFSLLLQREALPASSMHINDIKAIYAVKSKLLTDIHEPPNIASLAREAGMSEPKMRKLFKQTFGKGVFEYYQYSKMQLAGSLLKQKHLTVSEVGYQLGFTNLSHFSRVFEQHFGIKPKKFQQV